ncbi:MAG: hypothetical protein COV67_07830 [Nitrospinae bacterium CG11_big_fil_rev_8_21_14_0_20_56_8]|nr:MAG: hypothetical protein COV67_07830 [Nitrospinae bacterium CG11_big_fil_rev_8_21_14_0_20_56_8]
MDAEPAAGDERPQDGGHVGAEDSERRPAIDRVGDAVLRARVGVEDHRKKDDAVAEEDGQDGLIPVHAFGNQ